MRVASSVSAPCASKTDPAFDTTPDVPADIADVFAWADATNAYFAITFAGPTTSTAGAYDRDVLGVGVETVGTDAGQAGTFDPPFPNHTIMHGAGKFGLASLCNLDQLPARGAIVIAAPLKIVEGSGSPVRVLAITPAQPLI